MMVPQLLAGAVHLHFDDLGIALGLTLTLNGFIALAGGVGWLYQSKKLDREKIHAIKEML